MRRVLVVGGDSLLGASLTARLRTASKEVIATTRRQALATRQRPFFELSQTERWPSLEGEVAYIFAAETSIAACERDPSGTRALNVDATAKLVETLVRRGAYVCVPSTTLVFDGKRAGYRPSDRVSPVTEYGRQKADLEEAALQIGGERLCVVRVGKVVARSVPVFGEWIAGLQNGRSICAFSDMTMAPVGLETLCDLFLRIGEGRPKGILHFTASRDISYVDAARDLARILEADEKLVRPTSRPAGTFAPEHTALDSTETQRLLGVGIPDPYEAIDALKAPEA